MNMTSPTGPINEGSEVSLLCQAGGGKPLPDIRWYMIGMTIFGFVLFYQLKLRLSFSGEASYMSVLRPIVRAVYGALKYGETLFTVCSDIVLKSRLLLQ